MGDPGGADLAATIRRAGPGDAAELTRLRETMFAAMPPTMSPAPSAAGRPAEGEPGAAGDWRDECARVLRRRLDEERDTFVAVVAEDARRPGRLLACGVGWVEVHLPSPGNLAGVRGHIANVSTDPSARRQGLGQAVMTGLLEFFTERGIGRVDLFATTMGEGVYRSLGFTDPHDAALSWYSPARPS
jgi:ribosomal protein S18 acetylase RimI-like enzyme